MLKNQHIILKTKEENQVFLFPVWLVIQENQKLIEDKLFFRMTYQLIKAESMTERSLQFLAMDLARQRPSKAAKAWGEKLMDVD